MREQDIIDAINKKVSSVDIEGKSNPTLPERYPAWYIGITDNPEDRKLNHKNNRENVKYWKHWRASSEVIARYVEKHFLVQKMKGDVGGGKNPNYVYIY